MTTTDTDLTIDEVASYLEMQDQPNRLNDAAREKFLFAAEQLRRIPGMESCLTVAEIGESFYKLAVKERDYERYRVDKLDRLLDEIESLCRASDNPHLQGQGCNGGELAEAIRKVLYAR